MIQRSLEVRTPDGQSLRVLEWEGTPDFTTILLHGAGDSSDVWQPLAGALSSRVLAIDLPGHGHSQWDRLERYTPADLARALVDPIRSLTAGQILLVGHSLGGSVALQIATHMLSRTAGVVLLDYSPTPPAEVVEHISSQLIDGNNTYASYESYASFLQDQSPFASQQLIADLSQRLLRTDGTLLRTRYDPAAVRMALTFPQEVALRIATDALKSLAGHEICVTILRGRFSSVLSPEVARHMAHLAAPYASVRTIDKAGHTLVLENPAEVSQEIDRVVRSLRR